MNSNQQSTPVDVYLVKHRELKQAEDALLQKLACLPYSHPERQSVNAELDPVRQKLTDLGVTHVVPPRDFDVFRSDRDWQLIEFLRNNPKPKRPICHHANSELRRRVFKNGSLHIRQQCLDCGRDLADLKKSQVPNWDRLPIYDSEIGERFSSELNLWNEKYQKIHEALPSVEGLPDFDDASFSAKYREASPEPISWRTCDAHQPRLTRRIVNGKLAIVDQCDVCGGYIKAHAIEKIKKTLNIEDLPHFDEKLKDELIKRAENWSRAYTDAWKEARAAFLEGRNLELAQGKLQIKDNSTFGQYYESAEWYRTRERILRRDDNTCQSCGKLAECVHHLCYERLGQENDLDLISLCNDCHGLVHATQDSYKYAYKLTSAEIRRMHSQKLYEQPSAET